MPVSALVSGLASLAIGRDAEANVLALAAVSRQHVALVGPPGEAKSYLARQLPRLIDGATCGEWLMHESQTPEEIFGPWSLAALRADRYEHVTAGYAADVDVAILDEIGRVSGPISNALLHLLGPERQYRQGTEQRPARLRLAVACGNSWPEDAAMMDRWLLRHTIMPLSAVDRRALLTWSPPAVVPMCTLAELDAASVAAAALPVAAGCIDAIDQITRELSEKGITVSPRRLHQSMTVVRSAAYLAGHTEAQRPDCECLRYTLWTDPQHAGTTAEIVLAIANPTAARLDAILTETAQIVASATDAASSIDALAKLESLHTESLTLHASGNGRAVKASEYVQRERTRLVAKQLGLDVETAAMLVARK